MKTGRKDVFQQFKKIQNEQGLPRSQSFLIINKHSYELDSFEVTQVPGSKFSRWDAYGKVQRRI